MSNQNKSTNKSNTRKTNNSSKAKTTTRKSSATKNTTKKTSTAKTTKTSSKSNTSKNTYKDTKPKATEYSNNQINNTSTSESTFSFYNLLMKFRHSPFYAPIAVLVVSCLLIGIDLLLSWNDFSRFFKILGFELIIIGLFWLLRRTLFTFNSSNRR